MVIIEPGWTVQYHGIQGRGLQKEGIIPRGEVRSIYL